jgi:AraC-like DNA-binding protein
LDVQPRISAVAAAGLPGLISACGGDPDRIFGAASLAETVVTNPDSELGLRQYCDLFEHAARQTRLDHFGLRFGREYRIEDMGPLGMLAVNSPNAGAALNNLCRYFPAVQEHSTLRLHDDGDLLYLEYQIRDGRIGNRRQDAELTIAIFNNLLIRCFGPGWSAEEIHFEHFRGAAKGVHESLLNAPVYFGQSTNSIVFSRHGLGRPLAQANPALIPVLEAELRQRAGRARPDDLAGQVAAQIRAGFLSGNAGIEAIAAGLGLSRASLYRRLAEAGVDFSALTQAVRQEIAIMYVRMPDIAFTDIAALLGYAELSAFSRAFKRWTGASPAAYRGAV